MAMALVEQVYLIITGAIVVAGIAMVWLSIRAYRQRPEKTFIYLSLGFALIVAATISTAISAYLTEFQSGQSLLLVNNGLVLLGFLFLVSSLIFYQ